MSRRDDLRASRSVLVAGIAEYRELYSYEKSKGEQVEGRFAELNRRIDRLNKLDAEIARLS